MVGVTVHRPEIWAQLSLLSRQIGTMMLDLIFPPHCVSCDRVGSFLCWRCRDTISPALPRSLAEFDGVYIRSSYDGVIRAAIHAFKYENLRRLSEPLGELLVETVDAACRDSSLHIDLITAVPLHETRLAQRGYNQAALLASILARDALARECLWSFMPQAITRIRNTRSQIDLSAEDRQVNVEGAFRADAALVNRKSVLVVDDVLTTGATLSACAAALRAAGAVNVYGAALAGAVFSEPVRAGRHDTPV